MTERTYNFIKLQTASPDIFNRPGLLIQKKWDGTAAEAFVEEQNNIDLIGRGVTKGKQSVFTHKFPEIMESLKKLEIPAGTRFLGEVVCFNPKTGLEEVGLVTGRANRQDHIALFAQQYPAILIIHDVISICGEDVRQKGYRERMEQLKNLIPHWTSIALNVLNVFIIENKTDGVAEWAKVIETSQEGLVARDPNATFDNGIYKIKREISEDCYCFGEHTPSDSKTNSALQYMAGGVLRTGVFANLIAYQLTADGKEVNVTEVGGGFTQNDRREIQAMLTMGEITRENPLVIEVKANGRIVESQKLRHPNFVRIRTDKKWQDCIIQ